ncbi:MAG: type II toxin-antitoxin system prevent-host-death family antitoxin [Chloroflexi bacterium]|nr:type II toxin-antitoxin system prevent-host-death family antitoxin [Chloroflexota bacterium]
MPDVGVRDLKANASEIIRNVREQRARYVITYRGQPVGLLMPLDKANLDPANLSSTGEPAAAVWNELTRLGEEIGREWRSPLTGAELLSEMRR